MIKVTVFKFSAVFVRCGVDLCGQDSEWSANFSLTLTIVLYIQLLVMT